jgi:hypothetical protein
MVNKERKMTKFEEGLDKLIFNGIAPIINEKFYLKSNLLRYFKNWHSDEQFQKLLEQNADWSQECKNINKINAQLTKENEDLKSQLQQQALPVVPECVGKWIEDLKSKGYGPLKNPGTYGEAISDLSDESLEKILTWISQHQEEFMRAWLDGYTVEKPQLFYLREKNTNYYLNRSKNNGLELVPNPYFDEDNQFTKLEIDSMETGSYEQIEVTE